MDRPSSSTRSSSLSQPPSSSTTLLQRLGTFLGHGFEGSVYQLKGDPHKVVKVIDLLRHPLKRVQEEMEISKKAGDIGVGPRLFESFVHENKLYFMMERLEVVKLSQTDFEEIKHLFEKAIRHHLVTLDSSFGRTLDSHELRLYDFGVSHMTKSSKQALEQYKDNDYFYNFQDMYDIHGLYEYFQNKS